MDTRNEYRIQPSLLHDGCFVAEYRSPEMKGFYNRRQGWTEWTMFALCESAEQAEEKCHIHAGKGIKNLGRLP